MMKARAKPIAQHTSRSGARAPSQRELFRRAAQQLGVSASDYERADILAQIAGLLMRHPAIGRMLAFKGGAIMTLVDGSPRLSADLDAVVVTGGAVRDRQIRAALAAELDGRRIVTDVGIVNPGRQSLQYPFVQVRSFSGLGDVNIRLEVSWREPPLLPTELAEINIPRDAQVAAGRPRVIRLPVLARSERIAEKVRAFLERGLDRDAFDLHYHAHELGRDPRILRGLIQRKLNSSELPEGCDLHAQFERALEGARQTWPRGLVIVSDPPEWTQVDQVLNATYMRLLRNPLRRR